MEGTMASRAGSKPETRRSLSETEGHSLDEEDQDDHQTGVIGAGEVASLGQ